MQRGAHRANRPRANLNNTAPAPRRRAPCSNPAPGWGGNTETRLLLTAPRPGNRGGKRLSCAFPAFSWPPVAGAHWAALPLGSRLPAAAHGFSPPPAGRDWRRWQCCRRAHTGCPKSSGAAAGRRCLKPAAGLPLPAADKGGAGQRAPREGGGAVPWMPVWWDMSHRCARGCPVPARLGTALPCPAQPGPAAHT